MARCAFFFVRYPGYAPAGIVDPYYSPAGIIDPAFSPAALASGGPGAIAGDAQGIIDPAFGVGPKF